MAGLPPGPDVGEEPGRVRGLEDGSSEDDDWDSTSPSVDLESALFLRLNCMVEMWCRVNKRL